MKRLLAAILALVLVCMGAFALSACNTEDEAEASETKVEPKPAPVPEGYKEYNNGDISFAYPDSWTLTDSSTVLITETADGGNNITVAYEATNGVYKDITKEKYVELVKPTLDAMGMKVSNVCITQTKNEYDQGITKINQTMTVASISMTQTLYILNSNGRTYTVTVTEVKKDATLVNNVFDTLVALK